MVKPSIQNKQLIYIYIYTHQKLNRKIVRKYHTTPLSGAATVLQFGALRLGVAEEPRRDLLRPLLRELDPIWWRWDAVVGRRRRRAGSALRRRRRWRRDRRREARWAARRGGSRSGRVVELSLVIRSRRRIRELFRH